MSKKGVSILVFSNHLSRPYCYSQPLSTVASSAVHFYRPDKLKLKRGRGELQKMRVLSFVLGVMATASAINAFIPQAVKPLPSTRSTLSVMVSEDCGCDEVVMSGKPTDKAKALNARDVIGRYSVSNAKGDPIETNNLIGKEDCNGVSIVCFLRSLG